MPAKTAEWCVYCQSYIQPGEHCGQCEKGNIDYRPGPPIADGLWMEE